MFCVEMGGFLLQAHRVRFQHKMQGTGVDFNATPGQEQPQIPGFSLEASADRSQSGRSVLGIKGAPFPRHGDEEDAV